MGAIRQSGSPAIAAQAAILLVMGALASGASASAEGAIPAASSDPAALEAGMSVLRGVVGRTVYVALPASKGYAWEWAARGERWLFDSPYKVRFVAEPGPTEIWTFPLARPGRLLLDFVRRPVAGPSDDGTATRSIRLWVMTPYEAQQHAPADLRDTILLR
ncbi:MAG TPA: hypothetical protein V6D00_07525 [Pantanalinema sp.]